MFYLALFINVGFKMKSESRCNSEFLIAHPMDLRVIGKMDFIDIRINMG